MDWLNSRIIDIQATNDGVILYLDNGTSVELKIGRKVREGYVSLDIISGKANWLLQEK